MEAGIVFPGTGETRRMSPPPSELGGSERSEPSQGRVNLSL